MALGKQISDKTLLKSVLQKMTRTGSSSGRVTATVRSGEVTLTGTLGYEHERRLITRSISSVPGVRRLLDQLKVVPKQRNRS